MISQFDISGNFALDVQGVEKLRLKANTDEKGAIKLAAQQFESLFLGMMLKSMRDASPKGGLFDSEQTDLYTGLLDQQLSQKLAATKGFGFADIMVKQLTSALDRIAQPGESGDGKPVPPEMPPSTVVEQPPAVEASAPSHAGSPQDFVNRVWPHALAAGRSLAIPPHFLIAQAALESGWGQHEIRAADGTSSHNLFGIKAGKNWTGPVVEAPTTEYINGVPRKSVARFRAYASYGEGFRDYAKLLRQNPRYAPLLEQGQDPAGFARGLQGAGYATDPMYADKIQRVLNSATMRRALSA